MANEEQLIKQTISNYTDGGTMGDIPMVSKAFHPSATMKFIKDEAFTDVPIEKFFTDYLKAGQVQERAVNVDYISISGNAAQAKLTLDYPTFQFVDFLNLLKIDNTWLIVGKIFCRNNK